VRLLLDEDTASTTLIARLIAAGYDVVQVPIGSSDIEVFEAAERLATPILTANVGRKGRHDPTGLYRLALERVPHHGVIGIFRLSVFRACGHDTRHLRAAGVHSVRR